MTNTLPTDSDVELGDYIDGIAAFLGGTANVIMQLALPPVGYGVVESPVESGKVTRHPVKRLRTTLTFLAVALQGTPAERAAYAAAVDAVHRQVHSRPASPVRYSAMDPQLQLWVAACLYWGVDDIYRRMRGAPDPAVADALYRAAERFGTTLQVRPGMWPPDRAAFAQYWTDNLARTSIDPVVRAYLTELLELRALPFPIRVWAAPLQRFTATGLLPQHFRDQMQLRWSAREDRVFTALLRGIGAVNSRLPGPIRRFPINFYLWDLRRRVAKGRPLV